ncbi:hypothetical protein CTAYLR_000263 [Chrysophaeum taylorii]|uniref:Uncharacterized protein n=1 Tax=Chrysophaeum taylorii TaxID=2483200 RepID=A0AAD7UF57_9STRA|nr:hypothetical protein CTAYLR_000263 [Chrysophaeum taylorii]
MSTDRPPKVVVAAVAEDDDEAPLLLKSLADDDIKHQRERRGRVSFVLWWEWVTSRYTEPFEPTIDGPTWWYRSGPISKDGEMPASAAAAPWLADLWAFPNWSLASHYVNIGIAVNFLSTPVTYYLVESLDASAAVVNTYTALTFLPWCFKLFFGLQSDLVPWLGMHRRSYYAAGWLTFLGCNVWLAVLARPGVVATLLLSFAMVMGALFSDTVADAVILECTKAGEHGASTGKMRTHGYLARQVGATLGAVLGAILYNGRRDGGTWTWGLSIAQCFWLQALLVGASIFPLVPFMYELPVRRGKDDDAWRQLWRDMVDFVSNIGVAIPLFYLYLYNVSFVQNPAWYNFLYDGLGFSDFEVGMLGTIGSLFAVAGLVVYEKYFFKSAWRPLYAWTTLVGAAFSGLQVLLVTGYTFGLPKIIFAIGDTSLADFVQIIPFLPTCIMFFTMIPPGTEGTSYALLSTWQNVASQVGYDLGTALACGANVSNSAIENKNWNGVLKLTIICSAIQVVPVFFLYLKTPGGIRLLPNNIVETKRQCEPPQRSTLAASIFFFLFFGSILASLGQSLYVVFYPAAC